jgi:putative transposase
VRHGHLPEREVMTSIGPVVVRQPRVRDRGGAVAKDAGRIRFTSAIGAPYARRSRSLEVLIPILYLKGRALTHKRYPKLLESVRLIPCDDANERRVHRHS